ncbi:hypothetical protein Q5427_11225 [Brochothrix thermosphacta]|uniref:hypothetical protein n=1 Tax=Brochothrix thermosphacta TaxID=2756 RepID=UPI0027126C02|nr:hypothetical protein [Brochothrix thermosphacta]MDO7864861.1 hypothetical protein [Brochothrix thermosphacta]
MRTILEQQYNQYEANDTYDYDQHVLDSQNQKTPVWKEIKGDTDIIAEVGQKLSFNIYDAKLEHLESISDCKIVITRTKNNEESVKEYSLLDNNLLLIDESEVKVTNYVYIKGEAIELTEEQMKYLVEESVLND